MFGSTEEEATMSTPKLTIAEREYDASDSDEGSLNFLLWQSSFD
jgi:hypothetical protein